MLKRTLLIATLVLYTLEVEYRSIDGFGNNPNHTEWGASFQPYAREEGLEAMYADGTGSPSGENRPSPRNISNTLGNVFSKVNRRSISDFHTIWGQFVAMDTTLTPRNLSDSWPMKVPKCDSWKDPLCLGNVTLNFWRSQYVGGDSISNPRQQINSATSFLDGSAIYGNTPAQEQATRLYTRGTVYPHWTPGSSVVNPQIIALATIFRLEHNRLANQTAIEHPDWDDEQLYQEARRWNIAFIQKITTREYLGALLGEPLDPYTGFHSDENPTFDNFASAVAYRYGHSEASSVVARVDDNFEEIPEGHLLLRDSWTSNTNNDIFTDGLEPILRGMCLFLQQDMDTVFVDDMRNYLFRTTPSVIAGWDILATNIQRGRDHGVPDYNTARAAFKLEKHTNFSTITSDATVADLLQSLYGSVDNIDAYVGGLAEDHLVNSNLGPLMWNSVYEQMEAIRDGDRLWYENGQFTADEVAEIYGTTLAMIILRNTNIRTLPDNVFFIRERQLNAQLSDVLYSTTGAYTNSVDLSTNYRISWFIDNDIIQIKLEALVTGWIGIGFDPKPNTMKGADIYLCRIVNGIPEVRDSWALDVGVPTLDTDIGGTNDVLWFNGSEVDGLTTIEFRRKLTTGDKWDKVIPNKLLQVIFAFNPDTKELLYHGPTRSASTSINFLDVLIKPKLQPISKAITITIAVLAGLGFLEAFTIIALIIRYYKKFVYYTASFCILISIGGLVGYVYMILLIVPVTEASCMIQYWIIGIGYVLMFGCLFAKTWRLWRVHEHIKAGDRSFKMTQTDLLKLVGGLMLVELTYLLFWTIFDRPIVVETIDPTNNKVMNLTCAMDNNLVVGLWVAINAVLLFFGVYMTFQIRKVPDVLNESKVIGISIYTVAIIGIITIPTASFLAEFAAVNLMIKALGAWLVVTPSLFVLFIPKLFWKPDPNEFNFSIPTIPSSSSSSETKRTSSEPRARSDTLNVE